MLLPPRLVVAEDFATELDTHERSPICDLDRALHAVIGMAHLVLHRHHVP